MSAPHVVQPYARIVRPTPTAENGIEMLRFVEWCARISHASEEAQTETSWARFLDVVVLQRCDWSVTEHASVTVEALVDRGVTHETVRHRIAAYTQESTRFVNYAKKMPPRFIAPEFGDLGLDEPALLATQQAFQEAIIRSEETYRQMLNRGVTPQLARAVLPNALASKIVITYNLRQWRHFFLMRTSREAHPAMRAVASGLLEDFRRMTPLLFDDIEAGERQAVNMRKGR